MIICEFVGQRGNGKEKKVFMADSCHGGFFLIKEGFFDGGDDILTMDEKMELEQKRKEALEGLKDAVETEAPAAGDLLWDTLCLFQEEPFYTAKGLEFTFSIRGNEMFVTRKDKSITKATVLMSFYKALELDGHVSGPKKLGTFGASYLYPVFQRIGVIKSNY